MKLYRICLCICTALFLAGCADTSQSAVTAAAVQSEPVQKEEPEKLQNEGRVLINRIGYETSAQKLVIFRENLGTELFEVVNAKTEETVYRGTILEREYNKKSEENMAYGDFSKVIEPGDYYIKAGEYGRSDTFRISESLYSELLSKQIESFADKSAGALEDQKAAVKAADLMLSYMYFPEMFQEENSEQMPKLLAEAEEEIQELLQSNQKSGVKTAALAMAVKVYAPFKQELSAACQIKAEEDYPELKTEQTEGELYWAATELYKLTGKREYRETAETYLEKEEPRGFGQSAVGYFGTLAYLTTTYKTNVDDCTMLMEQLFDDAIEIVEQSSADGYKISLSEAYKEEDAGQLLENARLLTLMNIISKSKDYVLGTGNHLDYLCGRNPFGICYPDEENEFYKEESLIFILSGLTDSYERQETKE